LLETKSSLTTIANASDLQKARVSVRKRADRKKKKGGRKRVEDVRHAYEGILKVAPSGEFLGRPLGLLYGKKSQGYCSELGRG